MAEVQTTAMVGHPEPIEHAEPTALLLNPGGWVALAMIVVFALLIWQKVPSAIGKALDKKIDAIRGQLAEAESLRKEAEALKAEYTAKAAEAEKEAAAMVERAKHEAEAIRMEAEALKAEYAAKAADAEKEAAAMVERARQEADALIEKARKDADALVERRGRMAEEKIAAEERAAIQQLRSVASDVATRAAARLIAERVDAKADSSLVDKAIKELGR